MNIILRDRRVGAARPLFAAAAAGHHTLPAHVLEAKERADRIEAHTRALAEPSTTEHTAMQAVARKLVNGEDLDLAPVLDAKAQRERYDIEAQALRLATEYAIQDAGDTVEHAYEEITREHLAPAQADVIAKVAECHATYIKYGNTNETLFTAPAPARKAWLEIPELLARWQAIRNSVAAARKAADVQPRFDERARFQIIRNCEEVWPEIRKHSNMNQGNTTPWPRDDARARLIWFATTPGVELWCPTVEEQDARWHEVFGAQHQQRLETQRHFSELRRGHTVGVSPRGGR